MRASRNDLALLIRRGPPFVFGLASKHIRGDIVLCPVVESLGVKRGLQKRDQTRLFLLLLLDGLVLLLIRSSWVGLSISAAVATKKPPTPSAV